MLSAEEIVPRVPASESHSTQEQSRLYVTQWLLMKPCKHATHGIHNTNLGNLDLRMHPNTSIQRAIDAQSLPQSTPSLCLVQ